MKNVFITAADVAELLHKKKRTIYRYCAKGILPFYKIGKDPLFLEEEVIECVLKNRGGKNNGKT